MAWQTKLPDSYYAGVEDPSFRGNYLSALQNFRSQYPTTTQEQWDAAAKAEYDYWHNTPGMSWEGSMIGTPYDHAFNVASRVVQAANGKGDFTIEQLDAARRWKAVGADDPNIDGFSQADVDYFAPMLKPSGTPIFLEDRYNKVLSDFQQNGYWLDSAGTRINSAPTKEQFTGNGDLPMPAKDIGPSQQQFQSFVNNVAVPRDQPKEGFLGDGLGQWLTIMGLGFGGLGALSGLGAFGAAGLGGDIAGLTAMGEAAGLSGSALESFVASGGTLGSTAAGGGGIGFGAAGGATNAAGGIGFNSGGGGVEDIGGGGSGSFSTGTQGMSAWDQLIQSLTPSPTSAAQTGLSQLLQQAAGSGSGNELFGSIPNSISFPDLPANFQLPNNITPEIFQTFPESIKSLFQGAASNGLTASDATSLIGKLINGTMSATDYAKLAGTLGAAGLGVLGASNQTSNLNSVADKYLALGAPYRDKLLQSYGPGFDMAKQDTAYQGALDQSSNAVLRKLSAGAGNPWDQPGSLMEANKYVAQSTALPQLNTYRSQLGTFGQLGVNTAGSASTAGAQAPGGAYDAIGAGLAGLTQPTNDLPSLLKQLKQLGLNTGSSF